MAVIDNGPKRWDSDSDSEDGVDFSSPDPALYKHLPTLIDGATKKPITPDTTLVPLYNYEAKDIDNVLLKNLTGLTTFAVPCQLIFEDDILLPPTSSAINHGYHLRLRYNKLLLAPTVHLECNFVEVKQATDGMPKRVEIYHSLELEWHFNDYDGKHSGISSYSQPVQDQIQVKAGTPTSTGFNILPTFESKFGASELNIISKLKAFLHAREEQMATFRVRLDLMRNGADHAAWREIAARLPGGEGILLPSIGQTEYAAFGKQPDHVHSIKDGMLRPADLMQGAAKHPMVPLDCGDTFGSVKEAGVQLAYSAVIADAEAREALKLWSSVSHTARLFCFNHFPVLGIEFRNHPKLGSITDELHYRLPRDLPVTMIFETPALPELPAEETLRHASGDSQANTFEVAVETDSNSSGSHSGKVKVKGVLVENISGLPSHDAFFLITSKPLSFFGSKSAIDACRDKIDITFEARLNCATYAAQLDTVAQLQTQKNARWHRVLLNQIHDAIPLIDITTPKEDDAIISPDVRERADRWLMNWMTWNAEQLQVIQGLRAAKGGFIVILGPAGTGKTLLQQALAIYFYMLGFHVLALAPANSNADHLTMELSKTRDREAFQPSVSDGIVPELKFNRFYPSAKELVPNPDDDANNEQSEDEENGGGLVAFHELLNALHERKASQGTAKEHGVVQAVVNAAVEGKLQLSRPLRRDNGQPTGEVVDVWMLLRDFMHRYAAGGELRAGLTAKANSKLLEKFRLAYRACKGHIIGLNRLMITTTGNVRSQDMLQHWYDVEHSYGTKRVGVVVFVDEAAKDLEVNVWNGIVCEQWAPSVAGVVMFGDDKQLKPTNTCARGAVTFNAFNDRLDITLPCRLAREGFPCYRLLEQRRMHASISAFPNREIYGGKLRNGSLCALPLDYKFPGLSTVLHKVQAEYGFRSMEEHQKYMQTATDDMARLHWIEVRGVRTRHPSTKSVNVAEHVDAFFTKIFPSLLDYFLQTDRKVADHVMIICAYSYALHEYQDKINELLRLNPLSLTAVDMPRVLTVDASQGQEASMVIFDGSSQFGNVLGFMGDVGRCNVAITRAKEVFWIIGGSMVLRRRFGMAAHTPVALLTKYKQELDKAGKSHRFLA